MRGNTFRFGLAAALLTVSFYALRAETEVPQAVLDAYNLLKKPIEALLPDLDEKTPQQEELSETAPLDLEAYQDMRNQRERWNEMRSLIEAGKPLFTPLPSEIAISTSPVGRLAPAVPPPPGFTVQLPYESRLTVSGRKTIGITYQSNSYTNGNYATVQGLPTTTSSFQIEQQLQVRINGQIGRKVTVNVDFDDTKEDKKDISIVYKGDPDEIVQRAAFGDITLSLPQTEFAGYNKQLFGASIELKYKALHAYAIASRTKGQSETKEFTGGLILQRLNILDTSYVRHKYYNVTRLQSSPGSPTDSSGDLPINQNSLVVLIDDRSNDPNKPITRPNLPVDASLLPQAVDYTGNFRQLAIGTEYTFDPTLGIITLRNPLLSNAVVAIDYLAANGSRLSDRGTHPGQFKMIKFDESLILSIPVTEDLTHYTLGVAPIVRDNGQGNFTLQVQDLNGNNVSNSLGLRYLPNNAGNIFVDFINGTFNLVNPTRLDSSNSSYSDIYAVSPNHHLTFFVEFSGRIKTYTLRPNIVINSERISLNGRILARDVDYFIDYQTGFITFFNPDQITETSRVTATYDFSPFGIAGAQQDTLVGERTELSFYPISPILSQSLIGQTVLYDFAPKSTAAPDIRQTAGSFLLTESDVHFKDLIFNPLPFLKSSFSGEVARSASNPNTFGKAIIDNMEGIKDETTIGLSIQSWQIASNPTSPNAAYSNALYSDLANELLPTLTINPNASALSGDQQQVLDLRYDLTVSPEASIATILNPAGVDFSRKLFLEMFIEGDGTAAGSTPSQTEMNITLGQIDEDADNTNGGGFDDIRGSHPLGDNKTPRTEDRNYNNTLDVNEDNGWQYFNPDGSSTQVGAANLRLDTEDLDRSGVLDPENPFVGGHLGYHPSAAATFNVPGASGINMVDFTGWKFVRIPLNISTNTANAWTAIKELRISLRAPGGGGQKSTIRIGKIAVVGNKWQPQVAVTGSTIAVAAVSNETDPDFVTPQGLADFDDLNQVNGLISGPQPAKKRDTALEIRYSFDGTVPVNSTVTAISVSGSPMDFTTYGSLRMFVYGDGSNETFFFRAGSDNDYWEYSVPISWNNEWRLVRIDQVDPSGNQRPNTWTTSNLAGSTTTFRGSPNLAQVAQLKIGIRHTPGPAPAARAGRIWIDEIHAGDSISRVGHAARLQSDFEVLGWGKFGVGMKDIDANFQTFESAITNQARHDSKAYLNFLRLQYFPMNFTATKSRTVTPNVQQIGNTSLVSIQQQGRVDQMAYTADGTLQIPKWPKIGMLYDTSKTDTSQLFREDKLDHYGGTLDYTVPLQKFYLPKTISANYKRTDLAINFGSEALLGATDPLSVTNTKDVTHDAALKLSFQPLQGFTFNPNVSRSTTRESKSSLSIGTTTVAAMEYDRLRSQTTGFDSTLGIKRWFSPRLRYTISDQETFGIPLAIDTPGQSASRFKTVDRNSTGEFSWDFNWRDFSRKVLSLQSLSVSSSYLMEDGDSWNSVASGYNTLNIFAVRQSLKSGNIEAVRQNLTLRDTFRSTQRWNPFDWATNWTGPRLPLRSMSVTSTLSNTNQRQETTGTSSRILTKIYPDLIFSLTQTEYFFNAQKYMSNSQLNLRTQYKTVDTVGTSLEKSKTNGGDWRFTMWKKLDLFFTYTRTTDQTFDRINNLISNDALSEALGVQLGFNVGRWRFTPKYDQTKQKAVGSAGILTSDLRTRIPALQVYADLFLPAGLKLPFSDLIVFSNRIRTTNTISLTQKRSSLSELANNSDTYAFTTSEDYEITTNIRLSVGGTYTYQVNKVSSDANFYGYQFNSLLTIQF